jgi:hypothetical protein
MAKQLATSIEFETLLAPIETKRKPKLNQDAAKFLPWLAKHAAPELGRWNAAMAKAAVRGGYRNALFAATTTPLSKAIAVDDDGCRAARIRSIFVGASPILEDAEELWLASWAPTAAGTSQVWASHQDERELELLDESIADFVLRQYREDSYFNDPDDENAVTLSPALAALKLASKRTKLPKLAGPADLQPRTDWIVAQFFPEGDWYGIGDGIDGLPTFAEYQKDFAAGKRGLVQQWPHHQAYWLLHHLALENFEALAQLVPVVELSYSPTAELVTVAKRAMAKQSLPAWWPAKRLVEFRANVQALQPAAYAPSAKPALSSGRDGNTVESAKRIVQSVAKKSGYAVDALATLAELLHGAGRPSKHEQALIKAEFVNDERTSMLLRSKRGNAPLFQNMLRALIVDAMMACKDDKKMAAALAAYSVALLERSGTVDDNHRDAAFGALALFGATRSNFADFSAALVARFGDLQALSRLRRLEITAVAEQQVRYAKDAGARLYLRSEAARYAAQINSAQTDTAALALGALLRMKDAKALQLLTVMMRTAEYSRLNQVVLMAIVAFLVDNPSRLAAPALQAGFERGLGDAASGERALLAQALAKCDGALATTVLAAAATPSKAIAERAAAFAGLLQVASARAKHVAAARKLLQQLDPTDETDCGVGLALLRAGVASPAKAQFAADLKTWKAAKLSKRANNTLVAWLKAA